MEQEKEFKKEIEGWISAGKHHEFKSKWFELEDVMKVYLRKGKIGPTAYGITLATIEVEEKEQRKGLTKNLISWLTSICKMENYSLIIENVCHPGLYDYCNKNFIGCGESRPECFFILRV